MRRRDGDGGARARARRRRASSRVEEALERGGGWCDLNLYRVTRAVEGALARARTRARGATRSRAWGLENPNSGKTPRMGGFFARDWARRFHDDGVLTMMV